MQSLTSLSSYSTIDGSILEDELALLVAAEAPLTASAAAAAAAITQWEAAAGAMVAIHQAAELVQLARSGASTDACANHPAMASAAAVTLTRAVLLSGQTNCSDSRIGMESILRRHRVPLYNDNLATSLEYLDRLETAIEEITHQWAGESAPGFVAADMASGGAKNDWNDGRYSFWAPMADMPYERHCGYYSPSVEKNAKYSIKRSIMPSPKFAAECCHKIRPVLAERQAFLSAPPESEKHFCKCFTEWDHFYEHIAYCLVNQALEQFMVQEASDCLDNIVLTDEWEETYSPQHCPVPSFCTRDNETSKVRLLQNRE